MGLKEALKGSIARLDGKIVYTYRGMIERGNGKPGYTWYEGYSETTPEGKVLFPWMTYRECQQDARAKGKRATFEKGRLNK